MTKLFVTAIIFSATIIDFTLIGSTYHEIGKFSEARHYAKLAFNAFLHNRDNLFTILDSRQKEKYLKLKMIEEGRHPFYWGAFIVSGGK